MIDCYGYYDYYFSEIIFEHFERDLFSPCFGWLYISCTLVGYTTWLAAHYLTTSTHWLHTGCTLTDRALTAHWLHTGWLHELFRGTQSRTTDTEQRSLSNSKHTCREQGVRRVTRAAWSRHLCASQSSSVHHSNRWVLSIYQNVSCNCAVQKSVSPRWTGGELRQTAVPVTLLLVGTSTVVLVFLEDEDKTKKTS